MKLPKKISPNPLVTSSVEIRFISGLESESFLNIVYKALSKDLPNIKHKGIPIQLKGQQAEFKFLPDFILYNENFSFSFSENVFIFENNKEYPLWDKYFNFIKTVLSQLNSRIPVSSLIRVGVRYVSVFEQKNSLSEVIDNPPSLLLDNTEMKNRYFRSELNKDKVRLFIQIADKADVNRPDKKTSGVLIDIDSSSEIDLPQSFNEQLYSLINTLHFEQKSLFFQLLNSEFLKTLKPEY